MGKTNFIRFKVGDLRKLMEGLPDEAPILTPESWTFGYGPDILKPADRGLLSSSWVSYNPEERTYCAKLDGSPIEGRTVFKTLWIR